MMGNNGGQNATATFVVIISNRRVSSKVLLGGAGWAAESSFIIL
jgi:hypothetical protein